MTDRQIRIQYLLRRLRYKYQQTNDEKHTEILNRIVWYSMPVVYLNCLRDMSEITRAIEKRKKKKHRVNKYLRDMAELYDDLHFVTLTFRDEYITDANANTLHRYAQRWLNENCRDYFANADFGSKNGRLHFHAVVAFKSDKTEWNYGFKHVKKARIDDDPKNRYKISSYLLKLTNHASKLGTGKSFHKKTREDIDSLPDWCYNQL